MANEMVKEENIKKAIDAGVLCFIEGGIANTQILDVASKAGISKRSFLRYFGSKDNFVALTLKSINVRCYNQGKEYFQKKIQPYRTGREKLRALFEVTGEYFFAHPEVFILLSEGQSYLAHSSEKMSILSQYTRLRDYWPSVVLSLMQQGAEDGSITCFPKEYIQKNESNAVWYAFIGLLVQLAYSNALGNYPMEDCEETVRRFIDQAIQSLY